ncbi:MAG: GFA family protein [Hyphomicrobiaceae bacterium]
MKISGQCLCGAVRYRGETEPQFQGKCYCTDCRKTSAAGHAAMMGVAAAAIHITGELKEFHSNADSGADVTRAFCPTCGTGICSSNSRMPSLVFLRASTLDDPGLFSPQMIVWAARAPAWDPVNPDVPAFAERPTGM